MTLSRQLTSLRGLTIAMGLLERAKHLMSKTCRTATEENELIVSIDKFMKSPVEIELIDNPFQLAVQDTHTKSFSRSLGLDMARMMTLADDCIAAFQDDWKIDEMLAANRATNALARILQRATVNCINARESAFVIWMTTLAYEQTAQHPITTIKLMLKNSIH